MDKNIMKHECGCITEKDKEGIDFKVMCETHKINGKYIWVGMKHENA